MSRVPFPSIPVVEDGQAFSASLFKDGYKAGIEALLGESHGSFALRHVRPESADVYQTTWPVDPEVGQSIWKTWVRLTSFTFYYKLFLRQNSGNGALHYYWRFILYDYGTEEWYTIASGDGTDTSYANAESTADLETVSDGDGGYVADHLAIGNIYKVYLQLKTETEAYNALCIPWEIGTRGAVSGWTAPPTFAAEESDAADVNIWRTDLNALHDALSGTNVPTAQPEKTFIATTETWQELMRAVYRYRKNKIRVAVAGSAWSDTTWQWRVVIYTAALGGASAVVYTSEEITGDEAEEAEEYTWHEAVIDLTTGDAATAIAAAGFVLTRGVYRRIAIEFYSDGVAGRAWAIGASIVRESDGVPGAGYGVPAIWEQGDQDIGPTKLNVYSGDLTALYSGSEALFFDSPAVSYVENGYGYTFVHRSRYLWYLAPDGGTLYYGAGLADTYSLPASTAWVHVDLETIDIPYGGTYWAYGVESCLEADSA